MKIKKNPLVDIRKFFLSKIDHINKKTDSQLTEIDNVDNFFEEIENKDLKWSDNSWWSDKKMIKFWFFALLVWILGYFVYNTSAFIFTIIAAYIVSMIVEIFISWFQSIWLKRSLSIFLSYLIFVLLLSFLLLVIVPFIVAQTVDLISLWLNYLSVIQKDLTTNGVYNMIMDIKILPEYWKQYFFENFGNNDFLMQIQTALQKNISEIMYVGREYVTKAWFILIWFVSSFTTFLRDFVVFMTLSILFSVEKKSVMRFISRLSWEKNYKIVYFKLDKIYKRLWLWLKARLILSLYMALALFVSLWVLELFGMSIANKISLALVLWIFDVIPYIWPIVWSVPAVIWWITWYWIWWWIIITIIAVVINLVENSVLIPILMGKKLWMNTIVIFVSIIFGGMLMWLLWVFLAVPIAVIVTLLIENDSQSIIDQDIIKDKELKLKNNKSDNKNKKKSSQNDKIKVKSEK